MSTSMSQTVLSPDSLSKAVREKIDALLEKFPSDQKQSAVIQALMYVQEENNGYLTRPLMDAVALYLEMPKIAVYEVASFYSMYEHAPVGKHKICVCTSISCMLRGCDAVVAHLEKRLGIGFKEITPDGKFSLKEVECLGACVGAPMFYIGDQYYENLTPEKIDKILEGLE